jgi:heme-degrading monooxygenase HmoA
MGAENLINEKDSSIVIVISTWENLEDWRVWESSRIRQAILREADALLVEEPQVTTYRPMPTVKWAG